MTAWTVDGNPQVERRLSEVSCELASAIRTTIAPSALRTAAIIGGYGRGEGGVLQTPAGATAHNNIDLLIVSRGRIESAKKAHASAVLRKVGAQAGVPVDVGWVSQRQLRIAAPRVMWYDVRCGHRVLAGDSEFLSSMRRFRCDNIPVVDVIDLLTNRAALLVLARLLTERPKPSVWARREAIKASMKAVVGLGDALLWQSGQYRALYTEKARRMQSLQSVSDEFRQRYADAVAFRFRPDYESFEGREVQWVREVCAEAEIAHQSFIGTLFGGDIPWSAHEAEMLKFCLRHRGLRGWGGLLRTKLRREQPDSPGRCLIERLSLQRHQIAAALPAALYSPVSDRARRVAFVTAWGRACDVNFPRRLADELNLGETL